MSPDCFDELDVPWREQGMQIPAICSPSRRFVFVEPRCLRFGVLSERRISRQHRRRGIHCQGMSRSGNSPAGICTELGSAWLHSGVRFRILMELAPARLPQFVMVIPNTKENGKFISPFARGHLWNWRYVPQVSHACGISSSLPVLKED